MVHGTNSTTENDLDVSQLRELRARLHEQESRVSYWRRLIQARIDIMETVRTTESTVPLDSGPDLRRILTSPATRFPETAGTTSSFPEPRQPARTSHLQMRAMDTPDDIRPQSISPDSADSAHRWSAAQILALWERIVDPTDSAGITAVLADLHDVEAALSAQRTALLGQLDAATTALIGRYSTDPSQALSALPRIW
jgi:hypothetical protein